MRSMGKESVRAEILGFSSLVRFGRICVVGGGGAYAERTRDDQSKEGEGDFLCVCCARFGKRWEDFGTISRAEALVFSGSIVGMLSDNMAD